MKSTLFTSGNYRQHAEYWKESFRNGKRAYRFRGWNMLRHTEEGFREYAFVLDEKAGTTLKKYSGGRDLELFILLLSGFYILVSKYRKEDTAIFNTPLLGTSSEEDVYEPYVPLILQGSPGEALVDLFREVNKKVVESYKFQNFPLEQETPLSNIFIHMVGLHRSVEEEDCNRYDLNIRISQEKEAVRITFRYNEKMFDGTFIENLSAHYNQILTAYATLSTPLRDIALIGGEERERLLKAYNATTATYPFGVTVVELIEAWGRETPGKEAVCDLEMSLSYRDLNSRSNRLARVLRETYQIGPGKGVGLMLDKSCDAIVSILAILKAGGFYVPIDPMLPASRIGLIAEDATLSVMIIQSLYLDRLEHYKGDLLAVDIHDLDGIPDTPLEQLHTIRDLAYIIFTSGSTGKPKGVMIEHEGLVNLAYDHIRKLGLSPEDRILQFFSLSFDASVLDIFMTLVSGGTLVLAAGETAADANSFTEYIRDARVSLMTVTPSFLRTLQQPTLEGVHTVITGGEAAVKEDAMYYARSKKYYNAYGPSEATVNTSLYEVIRDLDYDRIPIGKPGSNKKVYILDDELRLVPEGLTGEICIAGTGLARGYLNDDALTQEKFVPNPYEEGTLLYRTGDLGRWLPGGNLDFCGRKDHQVKVRGYRIELGEIEKTLKDHPGVEEAVVIRWEDKTGDDYLIGYLKQDGDIEEHELRNYLQERLPSYMVPSYFRKVDDFVMTSNGKLDRNTLPSPEEFVMERQSSYEAPSDDTEARLVKIWQEVLGREDIGVTDDFFNAGGNSLKAVKVTSRIYKEFQVNIELGKLFTHATVRELARYVRQSEHKVFDAIAPVVPQSDYEVSHAQKRMWLMHQFPESGAAYNLSGSYLIHGPLHTVAFEKAFEKVVERHEILRTTFITAGGVPRQKIHDAASFSFRIISDDLREEMIMGSNDQEEAAEQLADRIAKQEAATIFDFANGPLLRGRLVRLQEEQYLFVFTMHHIISDGWSMEILMKEVLAFYHAFSNDLPLAIPPLRIQYKDYAAWQNRQLLESSPHRAYWLEQFREEVQPLQLVTDFPRPAVRSFRGDSLTASLGREESEALREVSRGHEASLFMTLLASLKVLLYRYTGTGDLVIGSPTAGRDHIDLEDQIGFYVNTLPLRTQLDGNDTFGEVLEKVKEVTLNAYQHQMYPFDCLVNELDIPRDPGRSPLFDIMMSYQNASGEDSGRQPEGSVKVSAKGNPAKVSKFDLTFSFIEKGDDIDFNIEYNTDLFLPERIERMRGHFCELIRSIGGNSKKSIALLDYIPSAEKQRLLVEFNDRKKAFPEDKTLAEMFGIAVAATPDAPAIVTDNKIFTYAEVDEKSTQLARYLKERCQAGPEDRVGLLTERSEWMIISMLAILKAGAAYVPVSTDYPQERIKYVLNHAGVKALITDAETVPEGMGTEIINLRECMPEISQMHISPLSRCGTASSLAYIIYTSGSTGEPKGVMIENRSIVNLALSLIDSFSLRKEDRVVQFASVSFDASVFEVFMALFSGASLLMVKKEVIQDTATFAAYLKEKGATAILFPPSYLSAIDLEQLTSLRVIITGGEAAHPSTAAACIRFCDYFNAYGPTECGVCVSVHQVSGDNLLPFSIPVGRPVYNMEVYLLDEYRQLAGLGLAGEIAVSGVGLSRGYWKNEGLTSAKFIEHPFRPGERIYLTGDLGRWRADGTLEFMGRKDDQVKVRGHRVEPGEVQNVLLRHSSLKDVTVVAQAVHGTNELTAYYIPKEPVEETALRAWLETLLPVYMIPAHFVEMESFPYTVHGKINRKALPVPEKQARTSPYVAPHTAIEKELVQVWEKVLGRSGIGIRDHFLMIGGDSIRAIQVASGMFRAGYKLEVKDILQHFYIEAIAAHVKPVARIAPQEPVSGIVPLTPIQKEFFDVQQTEHFHFNHSMMFYSASGFDAEAVSAVFSKIQEHHDALRMVFREEEGRMVQYNRDVALPLSLDVFDLHDEQDPVQWMEDRANLLQASIDLREGPLMKLALFRLPDGDRLLLIIHHLVVDGISWRILFEDIGTLFEQYRNGRPLELPLKTDSFKSWAEMLKVYADSEALLQEKEYWKRVEAKTSALIPKEKESATNYITDASTISMELSEADTSLLLTKTHHAFNTEINDLLISALGLSIVECFGQEDLTLAFEGHGREALFEDIDISRTIGWFTTIYPVHVPIRDEYTLERQIKEVKEALRQVPHKGIGYGILRYLTSSENKEDLIFGSKPQMSFNYLGQFDSDVSNVSTAAYGIAKESPGKAASPYRVRTFDIDITGMVTGNRLKILLSYNKHMYSETTLAALLKTYQETLSRIISFCTSRTSSEITPHDLTCKHFTIDQLGELTAGLHVEDIYTLSPMQEGMLFHAMLREQDIAYFQQVAYTLDVPMDPELVQRSLEALAVRHAILRTVFRPHSGERPLQLVLKDPGVDFRFEDLSEKPAEEQLAYLAAFKEEDKGRGFDFLGKPLWRVALFRLGKENYQFVWSFHHILMDGWCLGILSREFAAIYQSLLSGRPHGLPPVPHYSTYIAWLEKQSHEPAKAYWSNYLNGLDEPCGVTAGLNPDMTRGNVREEYRFSAGKERTERLTKLATSYGVTLNTLFQTLWGVMLGKYNNRTESVFGAVVAGRPSSVQGIESMIGLFINTVPVRIKYDRQTGFDSLLQNVQEEASEGEGYHHYPLFEIQAASELKGGLIDHILVFENLPVAEAVESREQPQTGAGAGMKISGVEVFEQTNYDFNLIIVPGQEITVRMLYSTSLFDGDDIRKIEGHLLGLIDQVLAQPDKKIGELHLLPEQEEAALFARGRGPVEAFPQSGMIHELIASVAAEDPHRPALIFKDQILTYRELHERSNKVAHYLRAQGLAENAVAGILMEKSFDLITGILGILKCGAIYLPLDPAYPADRIRYILEHSGAGFLLTDQQSEAITGTSCKRLNVPEILAGKDLPVSDLALPYDPGRGIYLIYTSGSTGTPKGAMIRTEGFLNLLWWYVKELKMDSNEVNLLVAPVSFDLAQKNLFAPLMAGGKLCLPGAASYDYATIGEVIWKYGVTTVNCAPAAFYPLLEWQEETGFKKLASLKNVILGGEPINLHKLRPWAIASLCRANVYNSYGPTECTDVVSYYRIPREELLQEKPVPIGRALPNISLYILDDDMLPLKEHGTGELCIGGICVSSGYWNDQELTAARFIHTPYLPDPVVYRTGDLARWDNNGNLEFIGRKDSQVKIRGYRIETGEIENAILKFPGIRNTVVAVRQEGEEKYLAAYLVTGNDLETEQLKEFLSQLLPSFMVPSCFMILEALPLTPSGKINHKALPAPMKERKEAYKIPANEREERMERIWCKVLNREKIGTDENFFDMGGHSLKAVQLVSLIRNELKREIPLQDIFRFPTIEKLSASLQDHAAMEKKLLFPMGRHTAGNPALFLVPPVVGTSVVFRQLADHLGDRYNSFGLQYKGFDFNDPFDESAEQMAGSLVPEVLACSSEEEIHLAGYSMGAVIAFEMTKKLEETGKKVNLILIDATPEPLGGRGKVKGPDMKNILRHHLGDAVSGGEDLDRIKQLVMHNFNMMSAHKVNGKIRGSILAIEASGNPKATGMQSWGEFTAGQFYHDYVSCNHFEIVQEKYVKELAEKIRNHG